MPSSSKPMLSNMTRVIKAPIVACLTCPLCGNLFREATTISECLHTFCRECIHEQFSDEESNCCPMCNVDLGTLPLEKLRADPQLDDVQNKIFAFDPTKRPATILTPSTQNSPVRRKERSLSSLGILSAPSSSKSRKPRRKAWVTESSESFHSSDGDDRAESQDDDGVCGFETLDSDSKSPGDQGAGTSTKKRRLSTEARQQHGVELSALACLAELANADSTPGSSRGINKGRESSSLRATKNVRRSSQGRANGAPKTPANPGLWFSLESASNQSEESGLPQIKSPYLRIRDGKLPVSCVKKYLARKLDLKNESEVEITCKGQPVVSSLPLENVRKIWLTRSPEFVAHPNSTGQEFLMVLTYRRNRRAIVS